MKQNFLWADDKHGSFDKQLLIGERQPCASSLKEDSRKKMDVTAALLRFFECINLCICHLYWTVVYFMFYKYKKKAEKAKPGFQGKVIQLMYMEDYIWRYTFWEIHVFPGLLINKSNMGMRTGWHTLQNIVFIQLSTRLNIYSEIPIFVFCW